MPEPRSRSQQRRLGVVLGLNLAMIVGLVVVGLTAHSLGVLAAGGDYLADSAAILLGIIAVRVRDRVGEHSRATTVVALVNASGLLLVTVLVVVEAIRRLTAGVSTVAGLPVLVVSAVATLVMGCGALVLGRGAGSEDLHMRSVLLDTLSDAVTSAAVAISGGVIYVTHGFFWLDPAIAVVIGLVIGSGAVKLLGDVVRALQHGTALELDDD